MSAGYEQTSNALDQRLGRAATGLRAALQEWADIDAMLNDATRFSDTILLDGAYGYQQSDIDTMRASAAAGNSLYEVAHAQATQANANDFFFDMKNLLGVQ